MNSLNTKFVMGALSGALLAVTAGCADLAVENTNQPDRERAIATPSDVETLIGSSFNSYYGGAHYWRPSAGLEVTSDRMTASWGNFAMRDLAEQPRKAYNNSPSYSYAYVTENGWGDAYGAISGASDGLRAIAGEDGELGTGDDLELGSGGADNIRAIAFARFVQGAGHCYLGLHFDKAFVVDETTDFDQELNTVSYNEMVAAGVGYLTEAIDLATSNSFETVPTWIGIPPGQAISSTTLAQVARGYRALCRANGPRSPEEAASVDWSAVLSDAGNSITEDFDINTDGGQTSWWDGYKTLGAGSDPGWGRVDWHFLGMADNSGNYQDWVSTPVAERNPIVITTPDLRIPADGPSPGDQAGNSTAWFDVWPDFNFPPERGTYHLSQYASTHWRAYTNSCPFCWFGEVPDMTLTQIDLLAAEANMMLGNAGAAATLINQTRVGNGGLTALTGAGTVPTEPDGSCVPHPRFSTDPNVCGDMQDALLYESMMEVFNISSGMTYALLRRHGQLVAGTILHFPIPGRELETLQMQIYTYGGVGNEGSAPGSNVSVGPGELVNGGVDASLRRAAFALDRLENRLQNRRPSAEVVRR